MSLWAVTPNFNSELVGVQFVARGTDPEELKRVKLELEGMVSKLKQTNYIKN